VAKLADAPDLGSGGAILRGSSPLPGSLLPLFFAYAGLQTNLRAIATISNLAASGAIIGKAVFSKTGGCLAAGRSTGVSWRSASGFGVLVNARGLTELMLLTTGLHLGIIMPLLFTIIVIIGNRDHNDGHTDLYAPDGPTSRNRRLIISDYFTNRKVSSHIEPVNLEA
jgi:hypothetical protein